MASHTRTSNESLLREAFRAMPGNRAQEIRQAYYKAVEGLRSLADALEIADTEHPGPASDLLLDEHLMACAAIDAMRDSLLGRIL